MKLSKKLRKKVEELTLTNYNFNENNETKEGDMIIEDLIWLYEDLQDEFKQYKEYVRENYKQKTYIEL